MMEASKIEKKKNFIYLCPIASTEMQSGDYSESDGDFTVTSTQQLEE